MRKIALCLLLVMASCGQQKPEAKKPSPVKVVLSPAISKMVPYYVRTIGNTKAFASVNIIPQVDGQITAYHFTDGTDVSKGDLLYTLDPSPFEASLKEAQGQHKQAAASLSYQNEKVRSYQGLLSDDYVSKLNYDHYISDAQVAEGQVSQYAGAVKKAEVNLTYCTIAAPFDGRCGYHQFDPGNVVKANQEKPLVTINQITPLYIYFTVAERYLPQINHYQSQSVEGLEVRFSIVGIEEKTYSAHLDFIDNGVDSNTGTILLRALIPNEDKKLWPGQFTHLDLYLYMIPNAILVPEQALAQDVTGYFLYVTKDDHTVEQRRVTVGQRHGNNRVIETGVSKGEHVVTGGNNLLYPGAPYEVKQ